LRLAKYILNYTYRPLLERYLKKDRRYSYKDISVVARKGVFHPGFFFSTQYLLEEIERLELKNKSLLELGCGSGLISVVAAKRGAMVTGSDINPLAVSCCQENARSNGVAVTGLQSDIFSGIPPQSFNYIIINPPYYRGVAAHAAQQAWYAGAELEYFSKLFQQIGNFMVAEGTAMMVLSEDCELAEIIKIAETCGLKLILRSSKKNWVEESFIYQILQARTD
jgi:release factor glutamine methyltransferase